MTEPGPAAGELLPSDFPVPEGCFLDVLGMRLIEVSAGQAVARMVVGPQHLNQAGVTQAGAVVSLADAVAGWATKAAVLRQAAAGSTFTTLEVNANILRAARAGEELEATAVTEHQGRTTAVVKVDVRTCDDGARGGRLVASFRCTQLVMAPRAAGGEG